MNSIGNSEDEWSLGLSSRNIAIGRRGRDKNDSDGLLVGTETNRKRRERSIVSDSEDEEGSVSDKDDLSAIYGPSPQLKTLKSFLFESFAPIQSGFQKPFKSIDDLSFHVFETTFDLTDDRLRRLFSSFDGNQNGTISYEELRLGLKYHGNEFRTSQLSDQDFLGLTQYLDSDNSGSITFEEFSEGIRLMLLRTLVKQVETSERNKDLVLTEVFDYNSIRLEQWLLKGVSQASHPITSFEASSKSLIDFFLEERKTSVSVRWINITGQKGSNILKMMALKYGLHPLAIEDALECTDHKPKADSYDKHYFIMVPVFHLKDFENIEENTKKEKIASDDETVDGDTDNKDDNENSFIAVHMTSIFITKPHGRTVITFNNERKEERCWYRLQVELKKEYSKLRQYDGQHLAYRLLDEAEDQIGKLVNKLKNVLKKEMKSVVDDHYRNLERIHLLKQEMDFMSRKFKSFVRLLGHVIEDDSFSPEASIYLRDVLDNMEIHEEDLKGLIRKCESVDEAAEKYQAKKMDNTLYTLTVISAIFLPAQFLTGVYGMNFEYMPELGYRHSYFLFWSVAIITMVITILGINFMRHS